MCIVNSGRKRGKIATALNIVGFDYVLLWERAISCSPLFLWQAFKSSLL